MTGFPVDALTKLTKIMCRHWYLTAYVWAALILLFALPVEAREPYHPTLVNPLTESWRWKQFPELQGKGMRCLDEDPEGAVWFGVNDGIIKYDGYDWHWYTEADGLTGSPVEKIYAAEDGTIYAATARGFFAFRQKEWETLAAFPENIDFTIHQIRELSSGSMMLCTDLGLLEVQPDGKRRMFTVPGVQERLLDSMPEVTWLQMPEALSVDGTFLDVSDVLETSPNDLWVTVTVDGYSRVVTFCLDDQQGDQLTGFQYLQPTGKPLFGETQKMLKASDGAIWMVNTSPKTGIHTFRNGKWIYKDLSDEFGGDEYTTDIVEGSDGTIWIGALGKLYTFKEGKWSRYKSPEIMIPANRVLLSQSRENNLWIAGHKSRVYRLDYSSNRWRTYKDLNFQCEGLGDDRWFLTVDGRVVKRQGNSWTAYGVADGLMDAPVRIIVTSWGQTWVVGSHEGVASTACFDQGQWHRQTHPELSWGIDYRAVFESADGSLWFGAGVDFIKERGQYGGVLQLTNPREKPFNWVHHRYHDNGLNQSNAYGIGQSPDGRIWIGGGNLFYFDGDRWDRPEESCLRQYVNIVTSQDDLLLVGSRYYGIFLYDGKKWQQYDTESGLISNTIISLAAGPDGDIWAATENDISRFDGSKWVNQVFPAALNLNVEGGSIMHGSDGAVWVNKSSRDWKRRAFTNGKLPEEAVVNFLSYRYVPDENPPETKIELFTEEVSQQGNTLISWTGEDFFGGTPDERLAYSYRLDGGAWSEFSNEEHHTFLNLGHGVHTLDVRARDLDLNVDPTPATIQFTVQPPVWKQTWFQLLLLAFLITIGVFEYRIISKKQKLEVLNKSLHQLNDTLQDKNDQVIQQQDQILAQKQKLEESYHNLEIQNEEIQLQRDKLEEMVVQIENLSKSKINFFTNISHELRTPLTLILGPVEQMRRPGLPAGDRAHLMDIVERNTHRLLKLINQLLEMRRIETNTLDLETRLSNPGQLLTDISGMFTNLAEEAGIQLSFHNSCPNLVTAFDVDKVEKMVANLLSNAFKHTPSGGNIQVSLSRADETFRISVSDTGKGMDAETMAHIFERYYIGSEQGECSGVGLSYLKDLVELHSGNITVDSAPGKGTTFTIALPLTKVDKEDLSQPITHTSELRNTSSEINLLRSNRASNRKIKSAVPAVGEGTQVKRILVVEDNKDMATFLESILSKDYVVLKAADGAEGLQKAKNHHLDLIVSDVMMPVMDGLTFCKHLKTDLATSHIPVILLTAKNMEEHRIEGYETGADAYLTKPFGPELLLARIENLLKQRRQLHTKFTRDFAFQPKDVKLTSPDEELLKKLVDIMEKHISDSDFNVNRMCEMVHLSHMHFIRKVKQLTGKKPSDLLKSYRMKRAKDLLKQNKTNIAEVAYMVGYDLPNSFSRAFKKEFKVSPSEFLESQGTESSPMT